MAANVTIVKVGGGIETYNRVQLQNIRQAVYAMGDAILSRSRITAPKLSGAMRNSATVKRELFGATVEYGNSDTGYAIFQEQKQFINYTTAGTGPHFLRNAGDSAVKQGINSWLKP